MISDWQIDWAVGVLENPSAVESDRRQANEIVDAYLRQEHQTLVWMQCCYLSRDLARMAERHYGARTRTR